jgi:hypothetical protein
VENAREIMIAETHLYIATKGHPGGDILLPDWFPAPRLTMPETGFAADYFSFGCFQFCSGRFRKALNQPEHVLQFAPVELLSGGPDVVAQDYRLLRILAHQPALDLERSDCKVKYYPHCRTGEPVRIISQINRYVLLDELQPPAEIFRMDEHPNTILVTDALAQRVLQAGCTGMEFGHIDNPQGLDGIVRKRTVNGMAERRLGSLVRQEGKWRNITEIPKGN